MSTDSFTSLPLSDVLRIWMAKNTNVSPHAIGLLINLGLLLIMFSVLGYLMRAVRYAIKKFIRSIMRFKWPVIIFSVVVFALIRLTQSTPHNTLTGAV